MKYTLILSIFSLVFFNVGIISAQDMYEPDADTAKIRNLRIDEITVRSPKYNSNVFQIPAAATMMPARIIENYQIQNLTDVTGLVPNFFMPDYGTKLTSPIFIRGIGTRINSPSVGLYVDNIPYLEKSAFNFDFFDLERIEILRGPQGTLYGRNTMGGIINIFTTEPDFDQHTSVRLSYGNFGQKNLSLLHNQPLSSKVTLMGNLNVLNNEGFYVNDFNGQPVEKLESYSGRLKLLYNPTKNLRIQFNGQLELSNQGGYPYAIYKKDIDSIYNINYDHLSGYDRDLYSGGVNLEFSGNSFRLRSATSYQYMNDFQDIDQDFTPLDLYYARQWQKQGMFAQEVSIQSYENDRYEWLFGVFGFTQRLDKTVDVFYGPSIRASQRARNVEEIEIKEKIYDNTNTSLALYHQSTFKFNKLSVSLGARLDYENATLDYQHYNILNNNYRELEDVESSLNFFEFLPKLAIQYNESNNFSPYATIAKGYTSGGFNATFEKPEDRSFEAEKSWNYEIGLKARFFGNKLFTNLALFHIDWSNQQIAQPVPSLQGSMLKNAGISRSRGVEIEIKAVPFTNFEAWTTFGYNDAEFVEYIVSPTVNYNGKVLPFAPKYNASLGGNYTINVNSRLLENINIYSVYQAVGKHYWQENNNLYQDAYGVLNSRLSFTQKNIELALWGKNLTNTQYTTYSFATNNTFVQVGKPATMGVSLKFMF
jgi:iron complex outermembrane recepter protein